eukprot:13822833-Ditylum_brightwellii.AAC.1
MVLVPHVFSAYLRHQAFKTGSSGYCKDELKNKLMGDDIERGFHSVATTTVDGVKLIALAHQGKSKKGKTNKATKNKLLQLLPCL